MFRRKQKPKSSKKKDKDETFFSADLVPEITFNMEDVTPTTSPRSAKDRSSPPKYRGENKLGNNGFQIASPVVEVPKSTPSLPSSIKPIRPYEVDSFWYEGDGGVCAGAESFECCTIDVTHQGWDVNSDLLSFGNKTRRDYDEWGSSWLLDSLLTPRTIEEMLMDDYKRDEKFEHQSCREFLQQLALWVVWVAVKAPLVVIV